MSPKGNLIHQEEWQPVKVSELEKEREPRTQNESSSVLQTNNRSCG